jgi:hypothetical protein
MLRPPEFAAGYVRGIWLAAAIAVGLSIVAVG